MEKSRQGARKPGWQRTLEPGCSGRKCLLGSCGHLSCGLNSPGLALERGVPLASPHPLPPIPFPPRLLLRKAVATKATPPSQKRKGKKKKRKSRVCARGSGRARPRLRPVTAARGSQPGRSAALGSRGLGRVATDICTVLQRTARTPSPPALGPAAAPPPASDPPISPRAVSLRSLQDQGEWKGECHQRASGLQGNHINLARHASAHTPCVTALPSVT